MGRRFLDAKTLVKLLAVFLTFITLLAMVMFLYYIYPSIRSAAVHGWVDNYVVGMILVVFVTIVVLGCIAVVAGVGNEEV